jgi:hypothetical protein
VNKSKWRYLSSEESMREWERMPHQLACAVELVLSDADALRVSVVTREWITRQLQDDAHWSAFGPLLIMHSSGPRLRVELETALNAGMVHSYFRVRR